MNEQKPISANLESPSPSRYVNGRISKLMTSSYYQDKYFFSWRFQNKYLCNCLHICRCISLRDVLKACPQLSKYRLCCLPYS